MKSYVVAVSVLAIIASVRGKSLDGSNIVGGQEVTKVVPYQVSLRFDGSHYGAGVVIAQRFVRFLT